ncbi:MAG TPA: hypothetical protein VJS47_00425 [Rhizomicrobium sp.]|nr:hypothetical protein [Rhizomicrobium sp.]
MTTANLGMTIPTVGADADTWGGELNTDLGLIDAFAGSLMPQAEVTLASAATTDIGSAASTAVAITGTTTITSFGTAANKIRFVRFTGALTLTHNAVSLILLGGVNRATAVGDSGIYQSDGSGNWRERAFFSARTDPSTGQYQVRYSEKAAQNNSVVTYFQVPLASAPASQRSNAKATVSLYTDDAAGGYTIEYSEWVIDFGAYGGSYLSPGVTRISQVQNSVSASTNQVSCTVTATIASGILSIKIQPVFNGALPSTTARVNAKCEVFGPDKTQLITAV